MFSDRLPLRFVVCCRDAIKTFDMPDVGPVVSAVLLGQAIMGRGDPKSIVNIMHNSLRVSNKINREKTKHVLRHQFIVPAISPTQVLPLRPLLCLRQCSG